MNDTDVINRHLLTHTSGFGYDLMNPLLSRWRVFKGQKPGVAGVPILAKLTTPLLFEPGESWEYGASTDWIGILVKRLTNTPLGEYMQKNVFDPLEISDISFHPDKLPAKDQVKMSKRKGIEMFGLPVKNGEKVEWTDELVYDATAFPEDEYGGQGSMGSAVSYMKVLKSLLKPVDGEVGVKLLGNEMADLLFEPNISPSAEKAYQDFVALPFFQDTFASYAAGSKISYGLGGALNMDEPDLSVDGNGSRRRKGTLTWSGLPNLLWTVDREAGLALFYASNVLPFGDISSGESQREWENAIYRRYEEFLKEGK